MNEQYDVIVIGGGFYGCCVALFWRSHFARVLILEKESDLLLRASFANQARVHNGYHYPRSYITALRSFINFPQFTNDFRECVDDSFDKVYVIPRSNSRVNAYQFRRLYQNIGAPIQPAPDRIKKLFNEKLIEEIFSVQEYAFDAAKLQQILKHRLCEAGVTIRCQTEAEKLKAHETGGLCVSLKSGESLVAKQVFNCTYSQINTLLSNSGLPLLPLKHEVAELALIQVPEPLQKLGVTVMDGPFFSTMPFPARGLHSLSHVRYTPRESWLDQEEYRDSHAYLRNLQSESRYIHMLRDAQRFMPLLREAEYVDSLVEIKTVLTQNEVDDGRPILFRQNYGLKGLSLIMGGKIDNVYDILQALAKNKQALSASA